MEKPIQEAFGQVLIDAVSEFARATLPTAQMLAANEFGHVADERLRRLLAQRLYGARWIYRVGLALLTKDQERAAHVRAQLLDYGGVVEGLLSYCIEHAIRREHTVGDWHLWKHDKDGKKTAAIRWPATNIVGTLKRQSFAWHIIVAKENGMITKATSNGADLLRELRNLTHLRAAESRPSVYLHHGEHGYTAVHDVISDTRRWCASHP